MQKRHIISIDEDKCNGCGICVSACAEGAIDIVDGKARLVSESYCDGLGACLPNCPMGAISLIERECQPFDEEAVAARMQDAKADNQAQSGMQGGQSHGGGHGLGHAAAPGKTFSGCPGKMMRSLQPKPQTQTPRTETPPAVERTSKLRQWPCQIKLVPPNAPYFNGAHLLVAADCTAFAYADIHDRFIDGKITIIGCPKLDSTDYSIKLREILASNDIKSLTVLKMEVPCCTGLLSAAKEALATCGKVIPWQAVTVGIEGDITQGFDF